MEAVDFIWGQRLTALEGVFWGLWGGEITHKGIALIGVFLGLVSAMRIGYWGLY